MAQHFIISEKEKFIKIPCSSILYFESDGNYTHIHLKGKKKHCSTKAIGIHEPELDEKLFFRVHDKFIVNLSEVTEYEKGRGGNVVLSDGSKIAVSFRKKKAFLEAFNSR